MLVDNAWLFDVCRHSAPRCAASAVAGESLCILDLPGLLFGLPVCHVLHPLGFIKIGRLLLVQLALPLFFL